MNCIELLPINYISNYIHIYIYTYIYTYYIHTISYYIPSKFPITSNYGIFHDNSYSVIHSNTLDLDLGIFIGYPFFLKYHLDPIGVHVIPKILMIS